MLVFLVGLRPNRILKGKRRALCDDLLARADLPERLSQRGRENEYHADSIGSDGVNLPLATIYRDGRRYEADVDDEAQ